MKLKSFNVLTIGPCINSDALGNYILSIDPENLQNARDQHGYHFGREFNKDCWANSCQALDLPCYVAHNITKNEPLFKFLEDNDLIRTRGKDGVHFYPLEVAKRLFNRYIQGKGRLDIEMVDTVFEVVYIRNRKQRQEAKPVVNLLSKYVKPEMSEPIQEELKDIIKRDYISVKEALQNLPVSSTTLYKQFNNAGFPGIKIGKRKLIHREKFIKWLGKGGDIRINRCLN